MAGGAMAAAYRRGSPRGSVCPGIAGWGWAAGVGPHRDLPAELSGSAPVGSRRGLAPWQPQLPATQSTSTRCAAWPWCRLTHSMTSALCAFTATSPHRDPTHARSSVLSESVSLWRVCILCGLCAGSSSAPLIISERFQETSLHQPGGAWVRVSGSTRTLQVPSETTQSWTSLVNMNVNTKVVKISQERL